MRFPAALSLLCTALALPAFAAPKTREPVEPKRVGSGACTIAKHKVELALLSPSGVETEDDVSVKLTEARGEETLDATLLPGAGVAEGWFKFHPAPAKGPKSLCDKTQAFSVKGATILLFKKAMHPKGETLVAVAWDPEAGKVLAAIELGEGGGAGANGPESVKVLPDGFSFVQATRFTESTECEPDRGSLPDRRQIIGMTEKPVETVHVVKFKDGALSSRLDLGASFKLFQTRQPGALPNEAAFKERFGIDAEAGTVATKIYTVPQTAKKGGACLSPGSMNDVTGEWICAKKR